MSSAKSAQRAAEKRARRGRSSKERSARRSSGRGDRGPVTLYHGTAAQLTGGIDRLGLLALRSADGKLAIGADDERGGAARVFLSTAHRTAWAHGVWKTARMIYGGMYEPPEQFLHSPIGQEAARLISEGGPNLVAVVRIVLPPDFPLYGIEVASPRLPWEAAERSAPGYWTPSSIPREHINRFTFQRVPELDETTCKAMCEQGQEEDWEAIRAEESKLLDRQAAVE